MIVLFVAALHLVGAAALLHPQHQASSARASSAPPFPYGFALGSSTARVPLGDPLQYHGVVALPPGLGQARDEGRAAEPFCQGVALACAVAPLAARRARGLMGGSFLASWLGTTMAFFTSLHGDPGLAHLCLALGLLPRLCAALIFWPGFHSDRACASRALPSASFVQKPVENLFSGFLSTAPFPAFRVRVDGFPGLLLALEISIARFFTQVSGRLRPLCFLQGPNFLLLSGTQPLPPFRVPFGYGPFSAGSLRVFPHLRSS